MATSDPRGQPAGFSNLVGPGASYAGVDQGIDFTGGPFPVYALGDGLIKRVQRSGSGWPGEGAVLTYQLLSGPAKGQHVYVSEDFAPAAGLKPGSIVKAGSVLGKATGSGRAPGIEIGWATPAGIPVAPLPPPRPADQTTREGLSFRQFVAGGSVPGGGLSVGGAVAGAAQHVPGVVQAEQAASAVSGAATLIGRLTDPAYILRGLQIVAGATLILVGLVLLARQVALSADLPDPLAAGPIAAAASKVG